MRDHRAGRGRNVDREGRTAQSSRRSAPPGCSRPTCPDRT
jgi:hypothetical protein